MVKIQEGPESFKVMDKKQNDVKQEHYVPQSYLAWFADDKEKCS